MEAKRPRLQGPTIQAKPAPAAASASSQAAAPAAKLAGADLPGPLQPISAASKPFDPSVPPTASVLAQHSSYHGRSSCCCCHLVIARIFHWLTMHRAVMMGCVCVQGCRLLSQQLTWHPVPRRPCPSRAWSSPPRPWRRLPKQAQRMLPEQARRPPALALQQRSRGGLTQSSSSPTSCPLTSEHAHAPCSPSQLLLMLACSHDAR